MLKLSRKRLTGNPLRSSTKRQEMSDSESSSEAESHDSDNQLFASDDSAVSAESAGEEEDPDTPRIAQWEAEDDPLSPPMAFHSTLDKGEGPSRKALRDLKDDLSSLPFQTLLKARRKVEQSKNDSDSEYESSDDENDVSQDSALSKNQSRKSEKAIEGVRRVEKRLNKHAPVEMSSKRPVSRKRQVIEVKKVNYRDPRFSSLSGELRPTAFQKRYEFLSDMHRNELTALKENLKRAKKMLRSSPRDQREEREDEVQRLERAVKRAESSVNRDEREHVEREALEKALKEEKDKRKAGKGEWHLKKSEKRELLIRARHDALAEKGGRLAVKKAIEKKQKKISQKEKKHRPSFLSRPGRKDTSTAQSTGSKRRHEEGIHHGNKRRRTT